MTNLAHHEFITRRVCFTSLWLKLLKWILPIISVCLIEVRPKVSDLPPPKPSHFSIQLPPKNCGSQL